MCGIAGYYLVNGKAAEAGLVRHMCDQIVYRGPDDAGYHVDGGCAIGMRRLSIIDLSTGHQPIPNEEETVWVVFNGEIYDYQNLRNELAAQGHRFRTHSDTETLVHLYEETGGGMDRLRGMFAYAIWDSRDRSLFLARDRFGKKPLYYTHLAQGLYFGSELKCLRAAGVPLELDHDPLSLYFQHNYVPDPWTVFRGVKKLAPGGWLKFHADGRLEQGIYWKLPVPGADVPSGLTVTSARQQIRELFDESVRIRMIADVPLGAFLSGGIDSTSVVASMSLQSTEPVKTFSIGFEEAKFNELPYARLVAEKYHTEHHEIVVRPDAVSLVEKLVHHFDEPFGDSSAIPTFIVSEFAAQHVKVVLTGDGGDELFAGYESFFLLEKLRKADRIPQFIRKMIAAVAERLPYSAYGKNYLYMISRPSALQRYFELNYAPHFLLQNLLQPGWMLPADEGFLFRTFDQCLPRGTDVLTQAIYFEATAKLTGDMLTKVDRMSMANSLEVRCPLLDHQLAELAMKIPHSWKLRNGKGKQILIEALGDRLPPELLRRPKQGFGVPLEHWFRGSLREMLRDHLLGKRFRERGIVSPAFVKTMIEEHESGRRNNWHWLWILLMFELWYRNFEGSQVNSALLAQPV